MTPAIQEHIPGGPYMETTVKLVKGLPGFTFVIV